MYTSCYKTNIKHTLGGAELTGRGVPFVRPNGTAVKKIECGPTHVKPRAALFVFTTT